MNEATTTHRGSCHCGRVAYDVTAPIGKVMSCNCSMCGRTGTLLTFVPEESFHLKSGQEDLTDYLFNKHRIHHLFCKTCGVKSFARGVGPDNKPMIAINARCLDGFDPDKVEITKYDGKSH